MVFLKRPSSYMAMCLALAVLLTLFVFQNCGQGFQSTQLSSVNPLKLLKPPTERFVYAGDSINLSILVETADQSVPQYQWIKDGQRLTNQNAPFLAINNAILTDAGIYSVEVTTTDKQILTTDPILVYVVPQPTQPVLPFFSKQPQSTTVRSGGTAYLYFSDRGYPKPSIRWLKDGVVIPGETSEYLLFQNASLDDAGVYYAEISNSVGVKKSQPAALIVDQDVLAPRFVYSPEPTVRFGVNQPIILAPEAVGYEAVTYQWYFGQNAIQGANNSFLQILSAALSHTGAYRLRATNSVGFADVTVNVQVVDALRVVTPLVDQVVAENTNVQFSAVVSGEIERISWYKETTLIPNATTLTLSLPAVQPSASGRYRIVIENVAGTIELAANLTVQSPPVITTPPANVRQYVGGAATFSVVATGLGLNYQWYKDNVLLPGRTENLLSLNNLTLADAGNYTVRVSNLAGVVAATASLEVLGAPVITRGLLDTTVGIGQTLNLSVVATGESLTYSWLKNGAILSGQTASNLIITNATSDTAGLYRVQVENPAATVFSEARVVVPNVPVINSGLMNAEIPIGGNHTFTVTASGTDLIYSWYKDNVLISGATTASYTVTNATASSAGTYRVNVTNASGEVTSSANLVVIALPTITTPIVGATIPLGGSHTFTVVATGTGLTYSWYKDNVLISGATTASYAITNATAISAGTYRVNVTNASGTVQSAAALAALPAPTITTQITGATIPIGGSHTFTVVATGTGLTYSWYKDNVLISGATTASYAVTNAVATSAGTYRVNVTNASGTVQSSAALAIIAAPTITTQITGATIPIGGSHTFTVVATGTGLTYSWLFNGVAIPAATGASYTVTNATVNSAGTYRVNVTNASGTVQSSATLNIIGLPTITTDIAAATIPIGGSHTFTVVAAGTGLTYSWYKDNVFISGATTASYTITNATTNSAGTYRVQVTNSSGSAFSSAVLTILAAPTITVNLTNAEIPLGGNHTFTVTATGTGLTYTWYKDNVLISGATTASYAITNATASSAGTYRVNVTNASGTVQSSAALTIIAAPTITTQIAGATIPLGGNHTFAVVATGTGLTYSWYKDNVLINGATTANYTVTNAVATSVGNYRVNVTNASGTVQSSAALAVLALPTITTQIAGATIPLGGNHTFTVVASGSGLIYSWYKDNVLISGATTASYTVTNAVATSAGNYRVNVTNASGTVQSAATLNILPPPIITTQITGATIALGGNHTFTVVATGTGLTYAWALNSVAIPGATGASYTVTNATVNSAGTYSVNVTNASGTVQSSATLNIIGLPTITTDIVAATIPIGGSHTFTVLAAGTGLTYSWYKDNVLINGATTASYTVTNAAATSAGTYRVQVTNNSGSAYSSAILTVLAAPTITTQIAGATIPLGGSHTFTVVATGSGLTYSWYKDNVLISGATTASYAVTNAVATSAGSYRVNVTNASGTVQSSAVLAVLAAPTITTQITGATIPLGGSHTFTVVASGSSLTYSWYKDNILISGATTTSYTVTNAAATSAGTYRVNVTNASGEVTSSASLTIIALPTITTQITGATIPIGGNHTFTVVASGSGLTYAWYKDNVLISGATAASHTVTNAAATSAGTYRVNITNASGTVQSSAALDVLAAPAITTQIAGATIPLGGNHTFTVVATGTGLTYSWYKDNVLISGATTASYTVTNAVATSAGTYRVNVTNASGTAQSSAALAVLPSPTITTQITGATIPIGGSHTFNVVATGTGLTYSWLFNGVVIPAATSASYTVSNATVNSAGTYRVNVTNASGTVQSSATLNIIGLPTITTDIVAATIPIGGSHTFTVVAAGTGLTYSWYKDNVLINGATAASYTVTNATVNSAGTYRVQVTNSSGSAFSSAVLTILAAPTITVNIASAEIPLGGNHTFTVTATGTGLTYTWYKDNVLISGATTASYTVTNAVATSAGTYRVNVTNASGTAQSSATLNILPLPVITTQIAGATVALGGNHTFTVVATGNGLTYSWYKDNVLISGATTASHTVTNAVATSAGTYRVNVTNASGTVQSSAVLAVLAAPTITTQITGATIPIGGSHTFTVVASGSGLTYAWYKDNVLISGATTANYTVTNAVATSAGTYRVNVTNASGTVQSSATLAVLAAPTITTQIIGATIPIGGSHTFTVVASGSGLTYAWYKDNVLISGATTASHTVTNAQASSAGTYRVNVSNSSGTVQSSAVLNILPPPIITTQIVGATIPIGGSHTFTVVASGTGLTYAWYKDNVLISAATTASHTVTNATASTAGTYRVNVTNASGTVQSSAILSILPPPTITTQITGATIATGTNYTFTVVASGTGLTYAWFKDNVLISTATTPSYTVTNAALSSAGVYRVNVTNDSGTVSSSANLFVLAPPVITTPLQNVTVNEGTPVTFTVAATGSNLVYTWYRNNVVISGQNGPSYNLATTTAGDSGAIFRVNVSNTIAPTGVDSSSTLTVNINGAALYTTHCAGCHGALATSQKRNRTAAQIQNAINTLGVKIDFRSGGSKYLNPAQVQAISTALSN